MNSVGIMFFILKWRKKTFYKVMIIVRSNRKNLRSDFIYLYQNRGLLVFRICEDGSLQTIFIGETRRLGRRVIWHTK